MKKIMSLVCNENCNPMEKAENVVPATISVFDGNEYQHDDVDEDLRTLLIMDDNLVSIIIDPIHTWQLRNSLIVNQYVSVNEDTDICFAANEGLYDIVRSYNFVAWIETPLYSLFELPNDREYPLQSTEWGGVIEMDGKRYIHLNRDPKMGSHCVDPYTMEEQRMHIASVMD